ncbi:uncharacterized protein LOC135847889 [Planococcus citri]|uniref:uncharacterized protein LOC135847889 n=1 Tax=Planococcus citri TaxID=170843 RepID=UPI0031F9A20F
MKLLLKSHYRLVRKGKATSMVFDAAYTTFKCFTRIRMTNFTVILIITVQSLCLALEPTTSQIENDVENNTSFDCRATTSLMKDEIKSHLLKLQSQIAPISLDLLSPDVLSVEDPLEYWIRKTNNLSPRDIAQTNTDVNFVMNSNTFPESYIAYVVVLKSILNCQSMLISAKDGIRKIQAIRGSKTEESFSMPSDISLPPELSDTGLFSPDIFSDPDTPLRLVNKLLHIPKKEIPNLKMRIKNFANMAKESNKFTGQLWRSYISYCYGLNIFFRYDIAPVGMKTDLDKLKQFQIMRSNSPRRCFQLFGQSSDEIYKSQGSHKTEPNNSNLGPVVGNSPNAVLSSGSSSIESPCEPLPQTADSRTLPNILSFEIFSQADIFRYLVNKILGISSWKEQIQSIKDEADKALEGKPLPACYFPYATLLSSILRCLIHLVNSSEVDTYIRGIKMRRARNINGFNFLPIDISSSSELSEIFSYDIFSDPKPPAIFLDKILKMPSEKITNLKIQLQNFLQKWKQIDLQKTPFPYWYNWYAKSVFTFLQDESVLNDLKKNIFS